jgi:hypothetical protein
MAVRNSCLSKIAQVQTDKANLFVNTKSRRHHFSRAPSAGTIAPVQTPALAKTDSLSVPTAIVQFGRNQYSQ